MKVNPPVLLNNAIQNYHTLSFTAGQMKNHLCQWETITQDPVILNAIQRYNIEFEETPHLQMVIPKNIIFSASERERFLTMKLLNSLAKGSYKELIIPQIATSPMCLSVLKRITLIG